MLKKHLTETGVAKLKPLEKGRLDLVYEVTRGLVVRTTSTGVKSWCFVYRFGGVQRRFTSGRYGYRYIEELASFHWRVLFSTTCGIKLVSGFSKTKKRFEDYFNPQENWRFHDLRRTAATYTAQEGIHDCLTFTFFCRPIKERISEFGTQN